MRKEIFIILILIFIVVIETSLLICVWPRKYRPIVPKVAISIDDWGYNLDGISFLTQIKIPLNIGILPNLKYSQKIAQIARKNATEVLLHLPLEPHSREKIGLEKDTITTSMRPKDVRRTLIADLSSVPNVKGISNHMGSKATEDGVLMRIIFQELRRRNLYFLDNLVTDKSVCKEVARKIHLKYISRDIFLDNEKTLTYIKSQLRKLVGIAQAKGQAVGVAHCDKRTLSVLLEELPRLKKTIQFVYLSQLIRSRF